MSHKRGYLIVLEGPDGAGKTTQRKLLKTWLEGEGWKVSATKWNSSPLVRPLIKTRKALHALRPEEFCLLHAADFQHRLETEILPALRRGRVVLADRYIFTSLARDASRGLDFDWLLKVYRPILWPDAVLYFAVSPETSARRVASERTPHYYEAGQDVTGLDDPYESYAQFIRRVIREYDTMSPHFRFTKVDAEGPIYDQHLSVRKIFQELTQ